MPWCLSYSWLWRSDRESPELLTAAQYTTVIFNTHGDQHPSGETQECGTVFISTGWSLCFDRPLSVQRYSKAPHCWRRHFSGKYSRFSTVWSKQRHPAFTLTAAWKLLTSWARLDYSSFLDQPLLSSMSIQTPVFPPPGCRLFPLRLDISTFCFSLEPQLKHNLFLEASLLSEGNCPFESLYLLILWGHLLFSSMWVP